MNITHRKAALAALLMAAAGWGCDNESETRKTGEGGLVRGARHVPPRRRASSR